MRITGRAKKIAIFVTLGACLVGLALALNVTWIVLNWREVVPLVLGQPEHWPAWGWACMAGGVVLLGVFALVERRVAAGAGSPLIPARVLRMPGVSLGIASLFTTLAVFGGFFFVLALHLQGGLGDSALRAGLTFAPAGIAFALVSLNWQRVPPRGHSALIIAGFLFGFNLGLLFSFAMVALASGAILYDTSNVLHHYRTDQHVAGALALFASVALLFYYILYILIQLAGNRE